MLRRFDDQMRHLEEFHAAKIASKWPAPIELSKSSVLVILVLLLMAIAMNVHVRSSQYDVWHNTPSLAAPDSAYLFSTTDAPYFLRLAGTLKRGESIAEFESLLAYPDNKRLAEDQPEKFANSSIPILSQVIAHLSPTDHPADLLRIGNQIVIICAAITAILITVSFAATGYGLQGAIAAAGSGLSSAYLIRTAAGRIDTDMLNLGLLYVTFGAVIMAGRVQTPRDTLLWCIGAGILARLFLIWYDRSALVWLAIVSLILLLILTRKKPLILAAGAALLIAISGVDFYNPLSSGYLKATLDVSAFKLPNTLSTITEAESISPAALMVQATGSVELGLVCLFGLGLWTVRHPVMAAAMAPLLGLALLNFVIGNRFIFYATPIIWFGLAYFLTMVAGYIHQNTMAAATGTWRSNTLALFTAVFGILVAWTNSPTTYVPRPTFSKETLAGFAKIDGQFDARSTVVATWWDYGYASTFLNNLPVLHYGGAVNTATTHFVARALLDGRQIGSLGTLKFLANEGSAGISSIDDVQTLQAAFSNAIEKPSPNILLVVTNQMAGWMGSISMIGNWDIEIGKPIVLRSNPNGPVVDYQRLNCSLTGYPQRLACGSATFDLERGHFNGMPVLAGWAHTRDGALVRRKSFDHDGEIAVQIVQTGNRINVFKMHRQLFESSFNELYHLGQIEHPSISLHYDDYPHIRIYKIEGDPAG